MRYSLITPKYNNISKCLKWRCPQSLLSKLVKLPPTEQGLCFSFGVGWQIPPFQHFFWIYGYPNTVVHVLFVNTFTFLTLALKKSISLIACSKRMCVWNVLIWNCEYFKRLTIKGLEVSFYQKFTYFDLWSLNKSLKWFNWFRGQIG